MHADSGIFPVIGSNDDNVNDKDGSPNSEQSDADDMSEDALDDDPVHYKLSIG